MFDAEVVKMEKEKYNCLRCGYEMEIPYEVLMDIINGDMLPVHLPNVVCPFCGGYLVTSNVRD